jgi:1,4-alpha-glucan branching enzyme
MKREFQLNEKRGATHATLPTKRRPAMPRAVKRPKKKGPARRRIQFVLDSPRARQVILMGDFNHWDPKFHTMKQDPDGIWRRWVMIPPGRYEYRFWVDGEWVNDPQNDARCPNCFGSENNVIDVVPRFPSARR